ncbi:hypothetical protein BHE74_00021305 [Ensete ventricosum]|nr:hypothetical protein BHE74_00021305 [Ensete ventricosum]
MNFYILVCQKVLGSCEVFEERQVGNERFNIFSGCPSGQTATIVLRGGADQVCCSKCLSLVNYPLQFIDEAERSLHDAIMIVRRALKNSTIVPGGGAIDVTTCNTPLSCSIFPLLEDNHFTAFGRWS